MDNILLDTNVVSELVKPTPDARVLRFLDRVENPWLCSITFHELIFGAERAPDPRRQTKLLTWIMGIRREFAGRIIVVDDDIAESSGRLRALAAAQGKTVSVVDALIAGSAQARGLTLATRNTKDFDNFDIRLFNPWLQRQSD